MVSQQTSWSMCHAPFRGPTEQRCFAAVCAQRRQRMMWHPTRQPQGIFVQVPPTVGFGNKGNLSPSRNSTKCFALKSIKLQSKVHQDKLMVGTAIGKNLHFLFRLTPDFVRPAQKQICHFLCIAVSQTFHNQCKINWAPLLSTSVLSGSKK